MKRTTSHKRRWGTLIEAAKSGRVSRLIGRSRSEDSVCNAHHCNAPSGTPRGFSITHIYKIYKDSLFVIPFKGNSEEGTESDSNPSLQEPHHHPAGPGHHHHHTQQQQQPQHHHHHHGVVAGSIAAFGSGALAALRRKRKKFSASRYPPRCVERTRFFFILNWLRYIL